MAIDNGHKVFMDQAGNIIPVDENGHVIQSPIVVPVELTRKEQFTIQIFSAMIATLGVRQIRNGYAEEAVLLAESLEKALDSHE